MKSRGAGLRLMLRVLTYRGKVDRKIQDPKTVH